MATNTSANPLAKFLAFVYEVATLLVFMAFNILRTLARALLPDALSGCGPKCLVGRTALVTGAGHGIGRELALQLARLSVDVVCWDINLETCQETVDQIKAEGQAEAWAVQCDVSNREAVTKAAKQTRVTVAKPVSMLFNNAGILKPCKPFMQQTAEEIENMFKVNVFSQMWMVLEFWHDLAKIPDSHLVSMSSTAGLCGRPNMSTYCATKYAINGWVEALHMEEEAKASAVDKVKSESSCSSVPNVTTVYPFTVSTGLVKRPLSRFPWLIPFTSPQECARIVIDGVRRNKRTVFVPKQLEPLFALQGIIPYTVKVAAFDFLGVGVLSHQEDL